MVLNQENLKCRSLWFYVNKFSSGNTQKGKKMKDGDLAWLWLVFNVE